MDDGQRATHAEFFGLQRLRGFCLGTPPPDRHHTHRVLRALLSIQRAVQLHDVLHFVMVCQPCEERLAAASDLSRVNKALSVSGNEKYRASIRLAPLQRSDGDEVIDAGAAQTIDNDGLLQASERRVRNYAVVVSAAALAYADKISFDNCYWLAGHLAAETRLFCASRVNLDAGNFHVARKECHQAGVPDGRLKKRLAANGCEDLLGSDRHR